MGLEAATYISQLVATNPTAGDKKNQGDDHFRLLKAVLQTTLPNANRAFPMPRVQGKSANFNIVEADDNSIFFCDIAGGSITATLPASVSYSGWQCTVVKNGGGTNVVFVSAGTIFTPYGTVAKIRIDVPWTETRFIWSGGGWHKFNAAGESPPGTPIPYFGTVAPTGYIFPLGQSLLRADHPELFLNLSTTYGAVDGTHFNIPDLRDRFLTDAGSSYAIGAIGGEATHVLSEAEMPAHNHSGTTGTENIGLTPHYNTATTKNASFAGGGGGNNAWANADVDVAGPNITPHTHDITTSTKGSSAAHENRPPYFAVHHILRLC